MGFLSFLKRGGANDSGDRGAERGGDRGRSGDGGRGRGRGGAEAVDDVQQLRIRARRRLIGAAVLVGVAVIVFPLLFETQPRPIPVDLPIDIPRKDGAVPLAIPTPAAPATRAQGADGDAGRGIITESAEQAAGDRAVPPPEAPPTRAAQATQPVADPVPATRADPRPDERATMAEPARPRAEAKPESRPEPKPEARAERKPEAKPEVRAEARPERKPEPKPESKPDTRAAEAARAQALLEGRSTSDKKPDAAASGGRFIVQVGAYADGKAAQDVRAKVERLGLKTYTQAVDTADGKRIRVRVGPFASRDEADKAAARVRGGGLAPAVLTL
ncbi:SPOR domain-containing protein [Mitsuaria sp. GD03876]|uniref:SPOR domain-containing protein n=1 Tax=Mitsuaria sp. GD03876 TaxID=2975399 RepID=UPI0024474BDA|nr:SPOR domain-containing protein [Mitsuaria sp. GD03876]MDH0867248.1 SPOR domain-containing protein [Mitsuaria sp. GD03876]